MFFSIGKDKLQTNLAKYEELRLIHEQKLLSSQVEKAVRRMAFECKLLSLLKPFRHVEADRKTWT